MPARLLKAEVVIEGHHPEDARLRDIEVRGDDAHGLLGDIAEPLLDFLEGRQDQFLSFLIIARGKVLRHDVAYPVKVDIFPGQFEHCGAPACWRRSTATARPMET